MQKKLLILIFILSITLTSCQNNSISEKNINDVIVLENAKAVADAPTEFQLTQEAGLKTENVGELRLKSENVDVKKIQVTKPSEKKIIKKDSEIKLNTNVIAVETTQETGADITLKKTGEVNTIFYCPTWDFNIKECTGWQKTTIPFTENDTHLFFTVPHFTAYAGGWLNYNAPIPNMEGNYSNITRTEQNITLFNFFWNFSYDVTTQHDYAYSVVTDSEYLYIGGVDHALDMHIEKRNKTDGSLVWNISNNKSSSSDTIYAIAVDDSGIYAGGYDRISSTVNWYVEKRNITTGSLIWNESILNSGAIYSLVIDSTGLYTFGTNTSKWMVEKRNLTSGENIWRLLISPSGSTGEGKSIAIDSSAIYLGGTDNSLGNLRWQIQKRNLTDGSSIWNITSNPTANSDEFFSLKVDSSALYAAGFEYSGNGKGRIEKRSLIDGSSIWNITSDPTGLIDKFISMDIDSEAIYASMYYLPGVYSQWRIEKRNISDGSSIQNITRNVSDNEEAKTIFVNDTAAYFCGTSNYAGQFAIYCEKRDKNSGSLGYAFTGSYSDFIGAGQPVIWDSINYTNYTPSQTNITYQVATSDDSSSWSSFLGPDMTSSTYYTTSGETLNVSNSQYLKYQFYLSTANSSVTPTLSNIIVNYYYPTTYNGSNTSTSTFLKIWDDSDIGHPLTNTEMKFYANYSNSTSAISGCNISENSSGAWSSSLPMIYNLSSGLSYFNRTFSDAGFFSFNVTCQNSTVNGEYLSIKDTFTVYKNVVYLNNNLIFGKNVRIG